MESGKSLAINVAQLLENQSKNRKYFIYCKLRIIRDIKQTYVHFKTKKVGSETIVVGKYVFNQEASRYVLVKMIVIHKYSKSVVDHMRFKKFCLALQLLFKGIS